ncbi:MAG: sigma-70 family RNA polymerase sigma factor [Minwuia sp.]|uniref:sigma-70 family RNA polymerase sigma factor n=1 Tax=Minwuia sp. TaxID=2493630 RepID=UPI003A8C53AA
MTVEREAIPAGDASPEPDYSLLIRHVAERQDREAFADLFGHFGPRIKGFMMKSGASDDLAEEVVQETMVTLWTKARLYDPSKAGASTWIFTIARNKRIDLIRRRQRPEPDPHDPMFHPDPPPDGEESVTRLEDRERVQSAMKELPPEQHEVIRLSFFEGLPHSAIAEKLDLPLGTVKSRLRLAFRRVRTAVGDEM